MASSKHKVLSRQKVNSTLDMVVSSLRKENAYLKKALFELSRQHSQHNNLVEKFLFLEAVRLECFRQLPAENEKTAMVSEKVNKREKQIEIGCPLHECSMTEVTELQNQLSDALEKNKQWLEYDQQREAYMREVLARMLWLEKQLNKANQALSKQHNEDYSDEKEQISQMQEHYERLLKKAKDELEVLKEQVDMTHQNLKVTQKWCEVRQNEVEHLKQLLQTEKESRKSAREVQRYFEDEEQQLREETKNLQYSLDEERRRSDTFTLQFMTDYHHANQEKIEDLERQIKISSQDLEDERQNCSYLKTQMVRLLKMLKKTKDCLTKQTKWDQQDDGKCEVTPSSSLTSGDSLTSSPHSSLFNESFLACPNCRAPYPASQYRELMNHLEVCLD